MGEMPARTSDHDHSDTREGGDDLSPATVSATDKLDVEDSSTDPSSDGEIRNNSGTVKVKTSGNVGELGQVRSIEELQKQALAYDFIR